MNDAGKIIGAIFTCLCTMFYQPSFAKEIVDVELILAIDCSYSVDEKEYKLQTYGIAQALRNPETIRAIESGPYGSIAISIVQWSNGYSQHLTLPWYKIDDEKSAHLVANIIANLPRIARPGATSLSGALTFSMSVFRQSPYQGAKQIIDISGDGRNNNGEDITPARLLAAASGIIINGLPILTDDPTLDIYYKNKVITGPGAFAIKAEDYFDYIKAIDRKILKEIKYYPIGTAPKDKKTQIKQLANQKILE